MLEGEGLTSLFLFLVVFLRTAPVPKYLKMHYVKEEIGDGKGVSECRLNKKRKYPQCENVHSKVWTHTTEWFFFYFQDYLRLLYACLRQYALKKTLHGLYFT